MFDAIHHVSLHETHFRVTDKGPLCEALGAALEVRFPPPPILMSMCPCVVDCF